MNPRRKIGARRVRKSTRLVRGAAGLHRIACPRPAARPGLGLLLTALAFAGCGETGDARAPDAAARAGYAEVAEALEAMIEHERDQKGLAAMSIALVDEQGVAWAAGFGEQSPGHPATATTVYRVGSVSKLFTDIAVMQLHERGELDIDAPVTDYLPDFAPDNPSGTPITLRQLMSHRAGLIREPPEGNYFDDSGTDLAATIASLSGTPRIYPPETRVKYSNAGIAVVGYTLEVTQGEPFANYVKRAVLTPIGMTNSAFTPEPDIVDDLADAYMWGIDRPDYDAPTFELGMAPAGSMYSTVLDLARFIEVMFRHGELEGPAEDAVATGDDPSGAATRLLAPETLEAMWQPQFADPGAATGFGLGFSVQERFGERWLGHGGAIYGFSTQLAFLPGSRLGVVVVSAVDITNTVTGRVADAALELMLAAKAGEPLPTAPTRPTTPLDPTLALELEGTYGQGNTTLALDAREGRLFMTPASDGYTVGTPHPRRHPHRRRPPRLWRPLPPPNRLGHRRPPNRRFTSVNHHRPPPTPPRRPARRPPHPQPPASRPPLPPPHWTAHRRVRVGPQRPLHPGTGRPPQRPDRVVLPIPPHRDLAGCLRLPRRRRPLPRRAAGLHP